MSFSSEFFVNNRRRLMQMHPDSIIFIASNTPLQRSGDSCYPFRQDSNFWYLTGLDEANLILVLDTINDQQTIVLPEKTEIEEIFDGPIDIQFLIQASGLKNIISGQESESVFSNIKSFNKVYLNLAKKRKNLAINPFRQTVQAKIKNHTNKLSDIRPSLDHLRMVKQPPEIEAIKKAVSTTREILLVAKSAFETGVTSETQLTNIINVELAKQGLSHAYEPVVASGKNSLTLHYIKNNSLIEADCPAVLLDVGVEYKHYCADISRTYDMNNNPKNKEIIEAVTRAQKRIIGQLKPGMFWKEIHKLSEKLLVEELNLVGESVGDATIRQFYAHSVGHFLGLDVHDTGDYRKPLQENTVLTIEPGYYNPKNGFGVRIEDDILITATGAIIL